MDSKLFTLHTIETLWNKIKNKFYVKSANGIPKSDLDTTVQSSLSKADSALQKHQDISGKQDKSTAVTHGVNTAVGSATKPVYVTENGVATAISHSINADVPANAKFTDTTYSDATQSTHGLMTAADKKKLDGMDLSKYLPKDGTAKKADCLSTGQLKFGYIHNGTNTATSGKTWARVAYCVVSKGYTTITMAMLVTSGNSGVGLFDIDFRTNANCDGFEYFNVKQIITNFPERVSINDIKAISKSTSDGIQYEIWYNTKAIYGTRQFTCLAEQLYAGANSNEWKFENHTAADFVSSPPADGTEATYKNCGVVSTAETLTDSGWVTCPLAVTGNTTYPSSSSIIKVRKYGKLVRLEAVVKYTTAFGTGHNVAKIPEGYRPSSVQKEHGIITVASERIEFDATLGVGGNLSFEPAGSSSAKFNPGNSYECRMTYFID